MLNRPVLPLNAIVVSLAVLLSTPGCSSTERPPGPAGGAVAAPKPIDRVRAGIVNVDRRLEAVVASAEASAADISFDRSRKQREAFRDELREAEAAVELLRADATELRQRAAEYLALWSGRKMTFTAGGAVMTGVDDRRARTKAKYEEMVDLLIQARDQIDPLMRELQSLDANLDEAARASDPQALRHHLAQAQARSTRASALLVQAISALDELRALVNAS